MIQGDAFGLQDRPVAGNAETGRDAELPAFEMEGGFRHEAPEPLRHDVGRRQVRFRQDEEELFASVAGYPVHVDADGAGNPVHEILQDLIAGPVPVLVVDVLEVIDVDI